MLAEGAKNAALPHCCWVSHCEDAWTTTAILQIKLPWLVCILVLGIKYSQLIHIHQLMLLLNITGWSNQKCYLATLLLSSKLWRCMKNHSNPADQPSLTCTYLILDQNQSTDPCLTAFIITEDDMKPPKVLPCHIFVECQTMIIWISHHSTPTNKIPQVV